jgi:hypothetical protein
MKLNSPLWLKEIKSLSLNKRFLLNPPLKKGDIGGFTSGCLEKIPPHPPFAKGGKLFTDKF